MAQARLNARAGFDTATIGDTLNEVLDAAGEMCAVDGPSALEECPKLLEEIERAKIASGHALNEYCNAMFSEVQELRDCTAWKHWYQEAKEGKQFILQDLQNARVEVIDMLFFWISLAQILGMNPEDVFRTYSAKLEINHKRQDEGRSQEEHASHESENTEVV